MLLANWTMKAEHISLHAETFHFQPSAADMLACTCSALDFKDRQQAEKAAMDMKDQESRPVSLTACCTSPHDSTSSSCLLLLLPFQLCVIRDDSVSFMIHAASRCG